MGCSNNDLQCVNFTAFDINVTNCDWSCLKYLYLSHNRFGDSEDNICNDDKDDILGFQKPFVNLANLTLDDNRLVRGDDVTVTGKRSV